VLKVHAAGALSNVASSPGTCVFQLMMGTIVAWSSGNITFNAAARVNLPFKLDIDVRVNTIGTGTSAQLMAMGWFNGVHVTNADTSINLPTSAPALGTGFDSITPSGDFDLWLGFSNAQTGNGAQLQFFDIMQLAGFAQ